MNQDWLNALLGGGLIGLSATIMMLFNGRVAGCSGIFFRSIYEGIKREHLWRHSFIAGLIIGGALYFRLSPESFVIDTNRTMIAIAIAGFFVGFGTKLGSGCTSGHGVCGLSRFSIRSLAATLTFIVSGAIAVAMMNLILE